MPLTPTKLSDQQFSLNGECPHCRHMCSFMQVAGMHQESVLGGFDGIASPVARACCLMQCQGCRRFILGSVVWHGNIGRIPESLHYEVHYPLGKPNDDVSADIPEEVAARYKEALRCRHVAALGATVLMCRRSLQVSCDREKAIGGDLFKQIDDLAAKQRIDGTLRQMAHRIRLLGKQGAHGDYSDIDKTITEKDADDALTFMHHYLEFVYVLPAKLGISPERPAPSGAAGD